MAFLGNAYCDEEGNIYQMIEHYASSESDYYEPEENIDNKIVMESGKEESVSTESKVLRIHQERNLQIVLNIFFRIVTADILKKQS